MTHLRKMMLEELQRRNYSRSTIRHYIRTVEDFARRFRCSPDRLGPRHIREYQAELFQKRKLSANSVGRHLAALRFVYIKTLRRAWSLAGTPYPKRTRRNAGRSSGRNCAAKVQSPVIKRPGQRYRVRMDRCYQVGSRCEVLGANFYGCAARHRHRYCKLEV